MVMKKFLEARYTRLSTSTIAAYSSMKKLNSKADGCLSATHHRKPQPWLTTFHELINLRSRPAKITKILLLRPSQIFSPMRTLYFLSFFIHRSCGLTTSVKVVEKRIQ